MHTHSGIALYLEDGARFWMGSVWTPRRGDVLLVPDGAPHHRLDDVPVGMVGLGLCMPCLPPDRWGPPLREMLQRVRRGGCPVLRPGAEGSAALSRDLDALEAELGSTAAGAELAVDGLMAVITARLLRAAPSERVLPVAETPLVARALEWVGAHALEGISLSDVARAVGRAPTYLAARVKQETGHPVGYWIGSARMAMARELLLHSDENIDALAERVGYASPSHFHRTFRREHGLSPDRWRRLHQRPTR